MQVAPVSKTLADVFRGNFLRIPRFQRPYSWDRENLSDFWYDLVQRNDDDYFMGSMVTFRDGKEKNLFYIVDGQQRLTTITVALAVIRDQLDELGEADLATGVHNLLESKDLDNKSRFVVEHDPPNNYFQARIQQRIPDRAAKVETPEQATFRDARTYLASEIKDHVDKAAARAHVNAKAESRRAALIRLRDRLLALQFISIELTDEDDAYLIFETLNTRGKDLEISDLVKNLFTRLIKVGTKGQDTVRSIWSDIHEKFGSTATAIDTDTFLTHFWLSTRDYVSKARLFKEMKSRINQANAKSFLDEIHTDALIYADCVSPMDAKWAREEGEIRDSLTALGIFRVAQALPLALSVMRLYRAGTISQASTKRALSLVERFTFQFNAITQSRGGGGIANMYAKLAQAAHQCDDAQQFAKFLQDLKRKLEERVPIYEEFELGFDRTMFRSDFTKDRALVKYILRKLSENYGLPAEIDSSLYTIEHIQPDSSWNTIEEMFAVGSLGNLILVSEKVNQRLGTKPFAQKLEILKEERVPMDSVLSEAVDWRMDTIEQRMKFLADVAYAKIWKV